MAKNILYKIEENTKSLILDYNNVANPIDIAETINKNLHNMTYDEKINTYNKITNQFKLDSELLKFEMTHYRIKPEDKTDDFNLFIEKAESILNRYTWKAGGFLYEDNEWTRYDKNKIKYELYDNEVIFDNSLKLKLKNDIETYKFTKQLINIIKQVSDKYSVKLKTIKDYDFDTCWVIIMIKKIE